MSERDVHIGGAPNYCTLPATVITSGPTPEDAGQGTDFGRESLRTEDPSQAIRLVGAASEDHWIAFDFGDSYTLGMLNLIAHNLEGEDKLRIRASENPIGGAVRLPPSVVVSQTNLVGTVAQIDDNPYAPDGDYWTVTTLGNPTATTVRFDVSALGGANLSAEQGLQAATVHLQRKFDTYRADLVCNLSIGETGQVPKQIASFPLQHLADETVEVTAYFGTEDLVDKTGASFELTVECEGAGADNYVVGAVAWYAYGEATEYDTGLIPMPFSAADPLWSDSVPPAMLWGQRYANHIPADAPVAQYVRIDFQRRGRGGAIEVGVVNASPAFSPSKAGHERGAPLISAVDASDRGRTKGQQDYGGNSPVIAKRLSLRLPVLTFAEGLSLFQRIDLSKGKAGAFIVVPYPDGTLEEQQVTTVYGSLVDPDNQPLEITESPGHLAKGLEVLEKTGGGPR